MVWGGGYNIVNEGWHNWHIFQAFRSILLYIHVYILRIVIVIAMYLYICIAKIVLRQDIKQWTQLIICTLSEQN